MKRVRLIALSVTLASCSLAWADGIPCEQLATLKLPHVEITSAVMVAAGAFSAPSPMPPPPPAGGPATPGPQVNPQQARNAALYKSLPAFCRVQAVSRPTSDSQIGIEVWLPVEGWNGRLAAGGNGGFQSTPPYQSLAEWLKKGYATTGTDTGHQGNDEKFAIGHLEKLIDWGNRAVHEMAITAKALVAARYGSSAKYSYLTACSTGGRQAEVAAEDYPSDFDGIVVGDPANPMTRLQAGSIYSTLMVNRDEASFVPADKWAMIHKAVVEQCDALDGLTDNQVTDPRVCKFDINTLACKTSDATGCLTAQQIDSVNKIVAGLKNPRTGQQLYPGWPLGTPMLPSPVAAKTPDRSGTTTFQSLFQDGNWDYHTIDFDKDVIRADKLADTTMNAVNESKLGAMFARGGKILMYHGWFDPNISALISVEYYENAVKANGGLGKTYNSIRLFMIPEMYHCGSGDGPSTFDKIDTISAWVEKGSAPDQIVVSKAAADGKITRTRPICPYPQVAKYKGTGSIDEAENFVCAKP